MNDLSEPVFNTNARVSIRRVGREMQPLIVVDDVLVNPEVMVAFAREQAVHETPPKGSYFPGSNGRLPPAYGTRLTITLRPVLERVFGFPPGVSLAHEGFFGIATTPSEALQPLQTVPHFDSLDAHRVATVHYFCGAPYQGTAFFRHAATGFETIDARRSETYRRQVFEEMETLNRSGTAHVRRDMPYFEEIGYVEPVFNRMALYRTTALHAGILGGVALPVSPDDGRLTANSFISVHRS